MTFKHLKSNGKITGASVTLGQAHSVIFRMKLNGKKMHIEVADSVLDLFDEYTQSHPSYKIRSTPYYSRIPLNEPSDVRQFVPQLKSALGKMIDNYPAEYGCCALYEKCSDALKCVCPDKDTALNCYYHKNLRHGKIFYGKNKNA